MRMCFMLNTLSLQQFDSSATWKNRGYKFYWNGIRFFPNAYNVGSPPKPSFFWDSCRAHCWEKSFQLWLLLDVVLQPTPSHLASNKPNDFEGYQEISIQSGEQKKWI